MNFCFTSYLLVSKTRTSLHLQGLALPVHTQSKSIVYFIGQGASYEELPIKPFPVTATQCDPAAAHSPLPSGSEALSTLDQKMGR